MEDEEAKELAAIKAEWAMVKIDKKEEKLVVRPTTSVDHPV